MWLTHYTCFKYHKQGSVFFFMFVSCPLSLPDNWSLFKGEQQCYNPLDDPGVSHSTLNNKGEINMLKDTDEERENRGEGRRGRGVGQEREMRRSRQIEREKGDKRERGGGASRERERKGREGRGRQNMLSNMRLCHTPTFVHNLHIANYGVFITILLHTHTCNVPSCYSTFVHQTTT